jgi:hypothetical protein
MNENKSTMNKKRRKIPIKDGKEMFFMAHIVPAQTAKNTIRNIW